MAIDRRSEKRVPIELDVRVESTKSAFDSQSADLSPRGMFVATPRDARELPEPGAHVMLTFTLRESGALHELAVVGVVMWRRDEHDVPGLGISFFGVDPEVRRALERFCAVRAPLYGDNPLGEESEEEDPER